MKLTDALIYPEFTENNLATRSGSGGQWRRLAASCVWGESKPEEDKEIRRAWHLREIKANLQEHLWGRIVFEFDEFVEGGELELRGLAVRELGQEDAAGSMVAEEKGRGEAFLK